MNSIQPQNKKPSTPTFKPTQTRLNFRNPNPQPPDLHQKFRQIVQKFPKLGSRFQTFCHKQKHINLQFLPQNQPSWTSNLPFFVISPNPTGPSFTNSKPNPNFNNRRLAVVDDFTASKTQMNARSPTANTPANFSNTNSKLTKKNKEFAYQIDQTPSPCQKVQKLISKQKNNDFEFFSHLNLGKKKFEENKNQKSQPEIPIQTTKKTRSTPQSSPKNFKNQKTLNPKNSHQKMKKKIVTDSEAETEKFKRLFQIDTQPQDNSDNLNLGLSDLISYNEESVHPVDEEGNIQYKYRVPEPVKDAGVRYSIGMVNAILEMFF